MKEDLRIQKTKKAIQQAFLELIREKPIHRITVTELSKRALINKATFYLHYKDIEDLHADILRQFFDEIMNSVDYFSLFITDPDRFITLFSQTANERFADFRFLIQGSDVTSYQQQLVEKMTERIYETASLQRTKENDIHLDAALNLLLYLLPKYAENSRAEAKQTVIDVIRLFWPESLSQVSQRTS